MEHRHILKTKSGVNLIAVVFAIALSAVAVTTGARFISTLLVLSENESGKNLVVRILADNITEIQSRPITELPQNNHCDVREYSLTGSFQHSLEQQDVLIDDSPSNPCSNPEPQGPGLKVVVKVLNNTAEPAQVSFSPPTLKLPELVSTAFKQVQILGVLKDRRGVLSKRFQLTIYRRAK